MAKNNWKIKRECYNLIDKRIKFLEARVGYPETKRVQKGDTITFKDIKFEVIRVTIYEDFPDMIDNEDSSRLIPGVTKYKEISRVFNGTGEIVICTHNNNVAGVAFLKNDNTKSKICTFLVVSGYQKNQVIEKLLEATFKYLGTTKPLITISGENLPMFEPIIWKYNWELTQTMSKGHFDNTSRVLVYNGELPE